MSIGNAEQEVSSIESRPVNQDSCPDCGEPFDRLGACKFCHFCGFSPCG